MSRETMTEAAPVFWPIPWSMMLAETHHYDWRLELIEEGQGWR